MLKKLDKQEIARRLKLIGMIVDLMIHDLTNQNGGTSQNDFTDCISEFMVQHYSVEDEEDDIAEMSKVFMKIRQEFTFTASTDMTLWSQEFQKLLKLNK